MKNKPLEPKKTFEDSRRERGRKSLNYNDRAPGSFKSSRNSSINVKDKWSKNSMNNGGRGKPRARST